jgi:hypothetical protein
MKHLAHFVIVVLLLSGCKHDHPTQPPTTISMVPQWPMFHHDARHTGNVNTPVFDVAGPQRDTIAIAWRTPIDKAVMSTPAVGIDGTVCFSTQSDVSSNSSFYAINSDGSVKWQYSPIGRSWSSPAIGDDGSLYVGADGGVYAFTSSGQLKWKNVEAAFVTSSPAIAKDGTVFYVFGNGDASQGYLKAVDPSSGTLKWQVKGGDQFNSPAIGSDGTIYYSNEGTIRAVTPNGNVKWQYKDSSYTILDVWAIEVGYDGTIYFVASPSPYLYAIDNQGSLKWRNDIGATGADPCLDLENDLYVTGRGYSLMCVGSHGQVKSESPLFVFGQLNVPLTIDKSGIIYVGITGDTAHVSLEAFNKTTLLWKFGSNYPDNGGSIVGSPAIFNGSLYFAWEYGQPYLYSLH